MGIRTTLKPTSPARRYMTFLTNEEITKKTPEKSLLVAQAAARNGRNSLRPHHGAAPGRRGQAHAPRRRLPAREVRHPGQGGGDRVRSEPLAPASRCSTTATGRSATSSRRYGLKPGDIRDVGAAGRHPARQRAAAPEHPARHARAQRGAAAGQGRAALPERGHAGPAPGQGRRPRRRQAALRRGPAGPARRAWPRSARSATSTTRTCRSARRAGCGGRAFRPTVRGTVMNPVDHPMGGGEGKGKGNHPMTPWGKPTKGYKTRRGARPSDRYIVTRRTQVGAATVGRSISKGPYIDDAAHRERVEELNRPRQKKVLKTWSRRSTISRSSSGTRSPCTTAGSSSRST